MKLRNLTKQCLTFLAAAGLILQPTTINAGAFVGAGNANGIDLVTHPSGYTGAGGTINVNVCIVPGTPNATAMQTSVENVVNTWNKLVPHYPNLRSGTDNDIGATEVDFESVALHELGHCIGNAHPNAASESGLTGDDRNYTKAERGTDGIFNTGIGADNIRGSLDDVRGDDVNLHWYHNATNNPAALPAVTDSTTYSRDLANLPMSHNFAANADRTVLASLGTPSSEASMQQGSFFDEVQRELVGDDITTRQLANSGIDQLEGTADDYTYNLVYQGISSASSCDVNISFNDAQTAFAVCSVGLNFVGGSDNLVITTGNSFFNTGFNWHFSSELNSPVARADLNPPGLAVGDRSGSSTAIDGNTAVIGVRLDDHSGFANAGSVVVYEREPGDNWVVDKQIFGPLDSGSDQDKFGHAVAIHGDTIAVGAESDDDNGFRAGKVHLYGRNVGGPDNWGLITSVVGSDTVAGDFFGRSVALNEDTLAVGAVNADPSGNNSGAAYVFRKDEGGADNWGEIQKIVPVDGAPGDSFGVSIALGDDDLVIGAHRKNVGGAANTGMVYFYNDIGAFFLSDSSFAGEAAGDQFGISVDMEGTRAVVGAWLADSMTANQTGAAFTYNLITASWTFDEKISRPSQVAGDRFGRSVAISGDRILIGAPQEDSAGSDAGTAYSFELSGTNWQEVGEVTNPEVSTRDAYGSSVALDSVFGVIGAPLDNQPTNSVNNSGGAYLETL